MYPKIGYAGQMAWIRTIPAHEAKGELAAVYQAMASRPIPPVYKAPHGGAPGIILAHSLDPQLMKITFTISGSLHKPEHLTWAQRELVNAVTSSVNQCFY